MGVARITVALLGLACVLAGCAKPEPQPPFVTTQAPSIPTECRAGDQKPIPRLPESDVDATAAARDSARLAGLLKVERAQRRACEERLRALMPETDKPKS